MIRDNLQGKFPRCHYNKAGKAKQVFETEQEALDYIKKMNLTGYIIYQCRYCNKYHIAS